MYSLQSYRNLYSRIQGMIRALDDIGSPNDSQRDALASLTSIADEYARKIKILSVDSFMKRIG